MKLKLRKGFTLIELMIVVGIICILASLAIPQYSRYRENAQRAKCVSNLRVILEAKIAWRTNNPTAAATVGLTDLRNSGYFRGDTASGTLTCPGVGGGNYDIMYTDVNIPNVKPICGNASAAELGHVLKGGK